MVVMWENDDHLNIRAHDYWVKTVDFLQQNWALIEDVAPGVVVVYFLGDTGGVFDKLTFRSRLKAERGLRRNGFCRYDEDKELQRFLEVPTEAFHWAAHPNGRIYSSGRFWLPARERVKTGCPEGSEELLNRLLTVGQIRIRRGKLFDVAVEPKSADFDFGKVEGMLMGIAIGDSLGRTTESLLPAERKRRYGEIRDYIPDRHTTDGRGLPSDDTQLSFWTLDQLICDGGLNPANVAHRIATGGRIFGLGSAVRQFITNYKAGVPWYESGMDSGGNGALMRIAPILLPHLRTGGVKVWSDTALAAMITHNNYASISACLAFTSMLWELLDMEGKAPDRKWWRNRYVEIAADLEGDAEYEPRSGRFLDYKGPLWKYVKEKLTWAESNNLSVVEACDAWYSGAFLLETVPSVLYVLMRHAEEPIEAMVRAINDTKDNDTVGAIVGAALGALYGREAFAPQWVTDLSGRTSLDDDGRVFEIIKEARTTFWDGKISNG